MELKPNTRTFANLKAAFSGESQARTKYDLYASIAKKEGFEQISALFKDTANNEKEHAALWFNLVHGKQATLANIKDAAAGEHFEWEKMYEEFAQQAEAEGFDDIAAQFRGVAMVERTHEQRYLALAANLEAQPQTVFAKGSEVVWMCRNCGHLHTAKAAPLNCPVCKHPQAYFELWMENY